MFACAPQGGVSGSYNDFQVIKEALVNVKATWPPFDKNENPLGTYTAKSVLSIADEGFVICDPSTGCGLVRNGEGAGFCRCYKHSGEAPQKSHLQCCERCDVCKPKKYEPGCKCPPAMQVRKSDISPVPDFPFEQHMLEPERPLVEHRRHTVIVKKGKSPLSNARGPVRNEGRTKEFRRKTSVHHYIEGL